MGPSFFQAVLSPQQCTLGLFIFFFLLGVLLQVCLALFEASLLLLYVFFFSLSLYIEGQSSTDQCPSLVCYLSLSREPPGPHGSAYVQAMPCVWALSGDSYYFSPLDLLSTLITLS